MKLFIIAIAIALAATSNTIAAQSNKEFSAFLRTKDSLMHIAFYDKNISAYNQYFNEVLAGYNRLEPAARQEFKDYIQDEYYYLARAYAQNGDKNNALNNLEQSKNHDYAQLLKESDFDILRKEPRFTKFMRTAARHMSDYQAALQKEANYNEAEKISLPAFTYQPATDANLTALRTGFNLDSISGKGNDVSQIINLMKWVHYLIPHDGSKGNPQTRNAMSLITECRKDNKTLNCRGLAILLNEVYLAEGFKSRFVTCLPKDTADNDCHVINIVWSPSLKKWLWMDPTFMAYIMDEDGTLLSIEEVRDRLVTNRTLILNPDANRNHAASQTKSDYLGNYMAKNLYKLECPLTSEYNYETHTDGKKRKYLQLLPGTAIPEPEIVKDKHGVATYTGYYTNNPKVFWAAPATASATNTKAGSGHSQADYEDAMKKFKNCYNKKQVDCVNNLMHWPHWDEKLNGELFTEFGAINSYKFIGMEIDNEYEDVALFEMSCDNSVHCMGISLTDNNKIGTFRFKTYSNYIDWLLAKAIDKERATKK